MESMSPAEELPALYRTLLDRVAQIEASGRRATAYRLRAEATRIYSRRWDDRARRGLQALLNRTIDDRLGASDHEHCPQPRGIPAT
jgi:hypothetical protein